MERGGPGGRVLFVLATTLVGLAVSGCSSDSSDEVTIETVRLSCDRVVERVDERLAGFDATSTSPI